MTLVSAGTAIALKDNGTNPTTTTTSVVNNTSFSAAADNLVYIQRTYEVPLGDDFQVENEWYGVVYGYHRATGGFMGGGFVYTAFDNIISALGFNTAGTRAGGATFNSEPGAMGTLTSTYTDGGGTSRTIDAFIWGDPSSNSPDSSHWVCLALAGTSVPNSDNTFKSIKVFTSSTTYEFTRSNANVYDTGDNGRTVWIWDSQNTAVGGMNPSNVQSMHVTGPDVTISLNNGISEEMSGGSDGNPIEMSDYYKDGTYHNTTGIPTSGQIEFSDFYGKTRVGVGGTSIHATTWTAYFNWNYVSFDGFWSGGGSMTDTTFTLNSSTATINTFYAINGGSSTLIFSVNGLFANSGWSNIKIYLNQSNNSGTPDYTFPRSTASHSQNTSGNTTSWSWSGYSNLVFAGGTSIGDTQNNYMVID